MNLVINRDQNLGLKGREFTMNLLVRVKKVPDGYDMRIVLWALLGALVLITAVIFGILFCIKRKKKQHEIDSKLNVPIGSDDGTTNAPRKSNTFVFDTI